MTNMDQNEEIDGLLRTERMANVIGQEPSYVKKEIAGLVSGEQIPGSFGDLIKRSMETVEQHKSFDGTNVVSLFGKSAASTNA
jgi:hypothetical protein